MKRVFSFLGTVAVIAALAVSCNKDPKPVTPGDEPGPDEPTPEPAKEYFVSPQGAGTKDGLTAENAFGMAELRDLLFLATYNSAEPVESSDEAPVVTPVYEDLDQIDGYTINFADGKYIIPTEEADIDGLTIALPGAEKAIEFTWKGSRNAILSGNGSSLILTVGENIHLNVEGLSFTDGYSMTQSGGAISVVDGGVLNLDGTFFDKNWVCPGVESGTAKCSGGALHCAKGTLTARNCEFGVDNYARNGGSIFTDHVDAVATFENCTFKSFTYNTGGASNNSKGTQNFKDCTFDGCYTTNGTGGAIHANAGGCVDNLENCVFKNCRAFTTELDKETPNDNKASGIISMQTAEVNIKGCTFENCYSSAGAVILVQKSNAAVLKCQDSVFKGNKGRSRGIIQLPGDKAVAFFNNCVFEANEMVTGAWGLILHGGNPAAGCFNNCTIYGNTRGAYTNQSVALNNDGSTIFANSTYIGQDGLASVRNTNATNSAVLIANSILINKGATVGEATVTNFVDAGAMKTAFNAYNSILGGSYTQPTTEFNLNTSIPDATEATLAGGAYADAQKVYKWNGPAAEFAKMDASAFETALKSVKVDIGNTIVTGELGTAFYNWLVEIGAVGKDALGTDRGAAWWPGAYQGK